MSDQVFNVKCGFFDSINQDRLYSANDMNKPYSRVIADGVFASDIEHHSSDLKVRSAGSGMNITVDAGQGIFAHKWFENEAAIVITVPSNTNANARIDSVIIQIDESSSGRVGSVVYREGTAASNPVHPDINQEEEITEYRIADIYVGSGVSSIGDDVITDLRGSSECPWVTGLIQQVDTSSMWTQFQAAYNQQYAAFTDDYNNYKDQQRTAWEAFVEQLTDELTVSTNILLLSSSYQSTSTIAIIPIGIQGFNPETDSLQVFINGLMAVQEQDYTINIQGTEITLVNAISSGQTVNFLVFKSIIGGDISSSVSLMNELNNKVDDFTEDTGWIELELQNCEAYSDDTAPEIRKIGNRVFLRGAVTGITQPWTTIATISSGYRPTVDHIFASTANNGLSIIATASIGIFYSSGWIKVRALSDTLTGDEMIPIDTCYLVD